MIGLIPAESSIIVCLEVILVKFDRSAIVSNGGIKVALFTIGKSPIVIEVSLSGFNLNSCSKALNSLIKVASPIQ